MTQLKLTMINDYQRKNGTKYEHTMVKKILCQGSKLITFEPLNEKKQQFGVLTRSDANWPVQSR